MIVMNGAYTGPRSGTQEVILLMRPATPGDTDKPIGDDCYRTVASDDDSGLRAAHDAGYTITVAITDNLSAREIIKGR